MSEVSGYYDDGRYFVTTVAGKGVEVMIQMRSAKTSKGIKKFAFVSDAAKDHIKSKCGTAKIAFLRDDRGDMWMQVGKLMPRLTGVKTMHVLHKTQFFRVGERNCEEEHDHSAACAKVKYPFFPREETEEKSEKKSQKSRKSSKKSA